MFEVIIPTHPRHSGLFHRRRMDANPAAGVSGAVNYSKVAVFARLGGQTIRCLSGRLWVTIENDRKDHVLERGGHLVVPTEGKVVIGGKGRYFM